jgi:purine-binding chemotaxis protein CheW
MTTARRCCTFALGGRWFGLPVDRVREVVRHPALTPVPLAPPAVAGLINLRGEVVLAIDLRARLGIAGPRPERPLVDLILQSRDGVVSLLADEIGPVLEARDEDYETIPETVPAGTRGVLTGAYKLADRLLLVLDPDKASDLKPADATTGGRVP